MTKPEIITAIIAAYGAVLSTIAIVRQLVSDRVKVKLTVSRNMTITGLPYEGMTLVILEAINGGRRPVTITTFGGHRLYPHRNFVGFDSVPRLPCEITESKYVTCIFDQKSIDFSTIDYWVVSDSHGRRYKSREASPLKHWKSTFQRRFRKDKPQSAAPR